MILGPGGLLFVIGFALATHSSLGDRRKQAARWLLVAAWHATGLLVAGDCLYVVLREATIVGPAVGYIVAVYEVIGLVPLTIALPQRGWPGRIKAHRRLAASRECRPGGSVCWSPDWEAWQQTLSRKPYSTARRTSWFGHCWRRRCVLHSRRGGGSCRAGKGRKGDHLGYRASNPVVSDDGRFIAFPLAKSREAAGVGHGMLVLDLEKARAAQQ